MAKKKYKKRKKKSVGNPANISTSAAGRKSSVQTVAAETENRNRMIAIFALIAVALLLLIAYLVNRNHQETTFTSEENSVEETVQETTPDETPDDETPVPQTAYAQINVQDYGAITLELDGATAPQTVRNFIDLANSGFYDGLTFHRIMPGFMIQGGDPLGNGTGGSGTNLFGEFSANGFENSISHLRGTVSMARAGGDNNSASSQFFIVHEDSTFLDGQYAAFGHVIDGMDVVDQICEDANPVDDNGTIPAEEQPVITSIIITLPEDETSGSAEPADEAAENPDEATETPDESESADTPDESEETAEVQSAENSVESAVSIEPGDIVEPEDEAAALENAEETADESGNGTDVVIAPGNVIEPEDEAAALENTEENADESGNGTEVVIAPGNVIEPEDEAVETQSADNAA